MLVIENPTTSWSSGVSAMADKADRPSAAADTVAIKRKRADLVILSSLEADRPFLSEMSDNICNMLYRERCCQCICCREPWLMMVQIDHRGASTAVRQHSDRLDHTAQLKY